MLSAAFDLMVSEKKGQTRGGVVYMRGKMLPPSRLAAASCFTSLALSHLQPGTESDERDWKLTRRLCLHNRYFGFLESAAEAVEGQFANWLGPNEALRRLGANI